MSGGKTEEENRRNWWVREEREPGVRRRVGVVGGEKGDGKRGRSEGAAWIREKGGRVERKGKDNWRQMGEGEEDEKKTWKQIQELN